MDLVVGATARSRGYLVTREEVIAFAAAYDPQPFHLEDAAAAAHPFFDRLCASGWHTCAMVMRLTVDTFTKEGVQPLGGAGIDQIRWAKPVYPGDTLVAEFEVMGVTEGKPAPGMRIAKIETRTLNQHGELVMRHFSNVIFAAG